MEGSIGFDRVIKLSLNKVTHPLVENIFLKLKAAFTYVAITYLNINESSLWSMRAPFKTFKNKWISRDDVKLPAIASNIRAIRRTHLGIKRNLKKSVTWALIK